MPEGYVWPEGQISIYTGTGGASALVGYAQNSKLDISYGWQNHALVGGGYGDVLTGYRADLSIEAVYTFDSTLAKIAASATAVHVKMVHSCVNGSAGIFLYSGRIDKLGYAGSEANPYQYTLAYHANLWSAF